MEKRPVDKPEVQKLTLQQIINGEPSSGVSSGHPRAGVKDYIESVEPVVDSLVETFRLLQKYTLPPSKDLGRAIATLKQKTQTMQEVVAARNELICMLSAENVELLKQLQALRSKKSTGIGRISATALKRAKVFSGTGPGLILDSENSEVPNKARSSVHELDQELAQEFSQLAATTANKAIQVERWSSTIFEEIQGREHRKQADIKKLNEIISILTQEPPSDPLEMLGKRRTHTD